MIFNHSTSFKCTLLKPCKKLAKLFTFRCRKPVFLNCLKTRRRRPRPQDVPYKGRLARLLSSLHSIRRRRDVNRVTELKSFPDTYHQSAPYPSPITPAYMRMDAVVMDKVVRDQEEEVEDACRSFENYLTEMIVEEGKMSDLVDVEELLYSWKNLKCPVFVDLVCRFYGELCKDLFSNSCEVEVETPKAFLR